LKKRGVGGADPLTTAAGPLAAQTAAIKTAAEQAHAALKDAKGTGVS